MQLCVHSYRSSFRKCHVLSRNGEDDGHGNRQNVFLGIHHAPKHIEEEQLKTESYINYVLKEVSCSMVTLLTGHLIHEPA